EVQQGVLPPLNLAPGDSSILRVPIKQPLLAPGASYHLQLSVKSTKDERWAPKGTVVATEQFEMPYRAPVQVAYLDTVTTLPDIIVLQKEDEVTLIGKEFHVGFNRNNGMISSLAYRNNQ